jgi:zinc transporter 2
MPASLSTHQYDVILVVLLFLLSLSEYSVAIMSDAAHMLSDVSAFLVAIFAAWAATQPSTWHYSFGYHRAEILGALVSVLIIWALTGALVFEAVQRCIAPVKVNGKCE